MCNIPPYPGQSDTNRIYFMLLSPSTIGTTIPSCIITHRIPSVNQFLYPAGDLPSRTKSRRDIFSIIFTIATDEYNHRGINIFAEAVVST